ELFYLRVGPRLLLPEIIRGESNDHKLVFVLLVQFFEIRVLRRVATHGSRVHNEDLFSFECREVNSTAAKAGSLEIVNGAAADRNREDHGHQKGFHFNKFFGTLK